MVPSTGSYLASVDEMYLTSKSHACKGRFQISIQEQDHVTRSHAGDDRIDTQTRHCIRNFRVIQIVDLEDERWLQRREQAHLYLDKTQEAYKTIKVGDIACAMTVSYCRMLTYSFFAWQELTSGLY
jgi:hypothetical protein